MRSSTTQASTASSFTPAVHVSALSWTWEWGAPLLLHGFARSGEPRAGDPYCLYAVSNAGSLLGLLA